MDKIYSNKNNSIIRKAIISTAIRRFISRYLIGKREENEINSNNNLYYYLDKTELWPINFTKKGLFKEELNKIIIINEKNFISVGQASKLYDYLGGDLFSLEQLIKKRKEEKNNEDKNINGKYNVINDNQDNQNIINENKENEDDKLVNEIKDEEELEEEEEQSIDYDDNDEDQEFDY